MHLLNYSYDILYLTIMPLRHQSHNKQEINCGFKTTRIIEDH